MPEQLFYKYDLNGTTENSGRTLADDINSLGENEVLGTSEQDMVAYLVEKQEIAPLTIADESGIQMDYSEVQIDVSRSREYPILGMGPSHVIGTRLTFYVPFTGDADLFHCRPSTRRMGLPAPSITSNELVFTYETTKDRASGVNDTFKEELEQTRIHAARVNEKVNQFNDALPEKARQLLNARRKKLLQDRSLVESIGFPIRRRQNPPSTFVVPDVKRRIKLPKPVASSTSFSPEPTLDTNEYEDILSILSNMVDVMERSPSRVQRLERRRPSDPFPCTTERPVRRPSHRRDFQLRGQDRHPYQGRRQEHLHRRVQVLDRTGRVDQSTGPTAWIHSLA